MNPLATRLPGDKTVAEMLDFQRSCACALRRSPPARLPSETHGICGYYVGSKASTVNAPIWDVQTSFTGTQHGRDEKADGREQQGTEAIEIF